MHSYFQIINEADKTCLKLNRLAEPISVSEVAEYLRRHGIPFQLSELNRVIPGLTRPRAIELCRQKTPPIREEMEVKLSADKMQAAARFYPPSNDGENLTETEIIGNLRDKGVCFGVDRERIDAFLADRSYGEDVILARGQRPAEGRDAYIEYLFNVDLKAKPSLNEDGSVDFFNLNIINHVKKGDCLARLHPEVLGQDGKDVCGGAIRAKQVKKEMIRFGRSIDLSDDHREIYSQVDGHVTLVEKKVFVSNVMTVENVDPSTGNIVYDGNVQVNGNVCSNFRMEVHGNVEIRGVVEAAEIVADGNVTIARGVNGMGKGFIKAGGNVIAKFIENAAIEAGGYVRADCILHSRVTAGTEIYVDGRKGFIVGGHVSATNLIEVRILGADLGANTIIEIGVSPEVKQRYLGLSDQIERNKKTLMSAQPVLETARARIKQGIRLQPEQLKHIQEISNLVTRTNTMQEILLKELGKVEELMSVGSDAQVIVKDRAYPGTKIVIGDVSKMVKSQVQYCRFVKSQGDVAVVGMN